MKGTGFQYSARLFSAIIVLFGALGSPALAEGASVLRGKVSDVEGRAVEGARIFVYRSSQVRKPADFISAPTGPDGSFRMVVAPGKYRALARLKKTEGYGPLGAGDKHSGEPAQIEVAAGQELRIDFTVADLMDARMMKSRDREGPVRISGRIVDEKGLPVTKAYAVAQRVEKTGGMPDYLSAWVDGDGRYTLYLPRGEYSIGSALSFPPGQDAFFMQDHFLVETDRTGLDIVRKGRTGAPR